MDLTTIANEFAIPPIDLAATLSRRERFVVTLLACGASSDRVAEIIHRTPNHVRRTVWGAKQRIIVVCHQRRLVCPRPFPTAMLTRWVVELEWHLALVDRPRRPLRQLVATARPCPGPGLVDRHAHAMIG